LPINIETDRLLNQARSKLSFLSGALAQSQQGLDRAETDGLSFILTEVLESLDTVHQWLLKLWGGQE
jgi:hypothetical protein